MSLAAVLRRGIRTNWAAALLVLAIVTGLPGVFILQGVVAAIAKIVFLASLAALAVGIIVHFARSLGAQDGGG